MDPFDAPPSTPAVSFEPPVDPPAPRRGRTVAIVLGTAGVIGAGIVGVSALASADDPELTEVDPVDPAAVEVTDDDTTDDTGDEPTDEPTDDTGDDTGDDSTGEPIVIDLGDLGDLEGDWGAISECLDLPMLDLLPPLDENGELSGEFGTLFDELFDEDGELSGEFGTLFDELFDENGELSGEFGTLFDELFGEFPMLEEGTLDGMFDDEQLQAWLDELESFEWDGEWADGDWADGDWAGAIDLGDQVTVLGDDGLTVIDLGEGDASVTIERDGETGELTITTEGTATEQELGQWFEEFELPDGPFLDQLQECGLELDR